VKKQDQIDELHEQWAEAGGTACHPVVKKELYVRARKLGTQLPGMSK
jgi:hypothetical protein